MSNTPQKPFHLKSVVHRDKDGNITKISVEESEQPSFPTPAYDELVLGNKIPVWLRKQAL